MLRLLLYSTLSLLLSFSTVETPTSYCKFCRLHTYWQGPHQLKLAISQMGKWFDKIDLDDSDHHVVLLLQVDPLDQGLHLVGQPHRTDCPPASEDHPGVRPRLGVGQAHLQPVGFGDGPGPQTEPLVGRDQGGVVPEASLHQDTARARRVTFRMKGRSELIRSCLSKRSFSSVSSLILLF